MCMYVHVCVLVRACTLMCCGCQSIPTNVVVCVCVCTCVCRYLNSSVYVYKLLGCVCVFMCMNAYIH